MFTITKTRVDGNKKETKENIDRKFETINDVNTYISNEVKLIEEDYSDNDLIASGLDFEFTTPDDKHRELQVLLYTKPIDVYKYEITETEPVNEEFENGETYTIVGLKNGIYSEIVRDFYNFDSLERDYDAYMVAYNMDKRDGEIVASKNVGALFDFYKHG